MNIARWTLTRAKGRKRFIWVNGLLYFGVVTGVMWSIIMEVIVPSSNMWVRPVIALIVFPISGIFWSMRIWDLSEVKYQELLSENYIIKRPK